jgi:hypothetical protein
MRVALAAFVVALACCVWPQSGSVDWTAAERAGIEKALHAINIAPSDLSYNKRPFNDAYRLPVVDACLDDPLATAREVERMRQALEASPTPLSLAYPLPGPARAVPPGRADQYEKLTSDAPAEIRYALVRVMEAISRSDEVLANAAPDLTTGERQILVRHLPGLALEEDADFRFSYYLKPDPREPDERIWALLDKVDVGSLVAAADRFYGELPQLLDALTAAKRDLADWKGSVLISTPLGKVVVAGVGDDRHDYGPHVAAIIDLAGNDTYVGEVATGLGRTSIVIDLGGNDLYDLGDMSGGAGLLGFGMVYDVEGDDVYRAGHLSLGCGLAGVGVLIDKAGDDIYQAKTMTEGFAMFGLGWLDDASGNDGYRAQLFAQAASRTRGVGLLADRAGDDTYRAGGWLLNSPLFADVHYSFAQGLSIGYREDTGGRSGGFAMLYEAAGDDAYVGETYCQGASYWFSLAALLDVAGHDSYDAYHYAQSSAMHLTVAALMDIGGDDSYSCKFGASLAIGHDYGVAVLLDRAGNDLFTARDGTPGIGNANGVGLFVDSAGDDRYQGPPGLGNPARDSGSVGVFVDLGGADKYYTGLTEGSVAKAGTWGVALDLAPQRSEGVEARNVTAAVPEPPAPGSRANPGPEKLEELFTDASLWEVGVARDKVRAARHELIGIGLPACEFMVEEHLAGASRLQMRAFEEVFRAVGKPAGRLLVARLNDPDAATAKNALRLVADLGISVSAEELEPLLSRDALLKQAVRAAGTLRLAPLVPKLSAMLSDDDETVGLTAAIALGSIGNQGACEALVKAAQSRSLPLREAAATALVKIGLPSLRWLGPLLESGNPTELRLGLSVLRRLKSPDARTKAMELLRHEDWGVRLDAAETLFELGEGAVAMASMDREPDPYVRTRVRQLARGAEQ